MGGYWITAVEESFDEHGINATSAQIAAVAADMESAREMYAEATGQAVFSANRSAALEDEKAALRKQLQVEREKAPCPVCKGGTRLVPGMNATMVRDSNCYKCHGEGRYTP
jgi:excinuclease UvrABC ATPase subunit